MFEVRVVANQIVIVCRYFRQYLALVLANQMASALFRLIAAVSRILVISSTLGSFVLLILYGNDGFILSRGMGKLIAMCFIFYLFLFLLLVGIL